ncbi:unnamed protein product [Spirodela intermedia]|uniref:Transcription factor CBF/NF-Y/archaeal histone domain-containing protein n=1 Tax=Spirodela intermedia TaxID=51605 RepID=A0A7I8LA06_SPIIN|nr:unnamed protein product [Spirodela intermedia]
MNLRLIHIVGAGGAPLEDGNGVPSPGDKNDGKYDSSNDAGEGAPATIAGSGGGPVVREQDRFMPIANVIRIMRRVLPTHAKIADDAKETVQECVSEYISFVTSEANERCQQEQRKTITAEDLLWAMSKLGFDDYVQPLTLFLQRYREAEGDNRGGPLRGESLLTPLKRAASDAGLFSHPALPSPPFHHPLPHDQHPHNLQFYYHSHPAPPPPSAFFLGSAGTSTGAANGEGEPMPGRYYRDGAASSQASTSQGAPKDGFHPFSSYK